MAHNGVHFLSPVDVLSKQYYAWEARGRGSQLQNARVEIEPPFAPFDGHKLPDTLLLDDGREPTILSSLAERVKVFLAGSSKIQNEAEILEPEPRYIITAPSCIELQTALPPDFEPETNVFEQFLFSLTYCRKPLAFEVVGTSDSIVTQLSAADTDAPNVRMQLKSHFPEAIIAATSDYLVTEWQKSNGNKLLCLEFGLAKEFMLPLFTRKHATDPLVGLMGVLDTLSNGELGVVQVLFSPARHPWAKSIQRAVTTDNGDSFLEDAPEMLPQTKIKLSYPLYAVVVRVAARSHTERRMWEIIKGLAGALMPLANPEGNELIPLKNEDYNEEEHAGDLLCRQSRRHGMLLNSRELVALAHLPSAAVKSRKLKRETRRTKPPPALVRKAGFVLGVNKHEGEEILVGQQPEQRVRHAHIIGTSGTGKSTLLFNMIKQDIESGQGLAVLDPHGDLIDKILGCIPPERIDDVILIDPSDEQYSVPLNILSAHSDLEKNLLASDLISVFQRLSTSWGDQMNAVFGNAIRAFLESTQSGTLADLRRFLIEPKFRNEFLKTVNDPDVVYYWQKAFPLLSGNKSIGPVLTRLETFLSPKPIRYMVSQKENRLDFAQIMDTGKILLAKLSQGKMGKENSYLLGSLLVAKFHQIAMSRQNMKEAERRNFWLYMDEFHNFITPSMAEILTGARKYRVGLILAHQELRQLQRDSEVASAVLSNPYTRVCFRVGDHDAKALENGFSFFEAKDLQNLGVGEAICRVERSDFDFNLSVPFSPGLDEIAADLIRERVITSSRRKYALPRSEVEALLGKQIKDTTDAVQEISKTKASVTPESPQRFESIAEVPKSMPKIEMPIDAGPEASTLVIQKPAPPRDLGRGGAQHKSIQERIQSEAQALGYLAEIECQLAAGSIEAADLILRKGDVALAVEISVTTTVDHEFGNVKKCLVAGFSRVAVVSPKLEKLQAIREAVEAGLGAEASMKVGYYTPDELIAELKRLAAEAAKKPAPPSIPNESKKRGYTVRRHKPALTADEHWAKVEMAYKVMSETMKPK